MLHLFIFCVLFLGLFSQAGIVEASPTSGGFLPQIPQVELKIGGDADTPESTTTTMQLLLIFTVLSIAPAILILMTCFTRIIVVLSFVRTSLATQQMPPNQVLVGIALFLTFFIMAPTLQTINDNAVQPFMQGKLSQEQALTEAITPLKSFMLKQTRQKDLALFLEYSRAEKPASIEDVSLVALVPAFAISELKTAFQIGFMLFIPFLVIDMIVASILMGMGMMMLPPVMISLPFKILLFIMVDGWYLVIKSLFLSF
nr:flagellar type III secretion system pore protein FliP [Brevibacillus daliensis]